MNETLTHIQAPVAVFIMVITIATTLYAFSDENALANMILHPYSVYRGQRSYTVITSGLIHNDWMHLIFNMASYYCFAFTLEKNIGHWQFGVLYIVSLVLSDIPTIFKHKNDYQYRCLGASGAVSAVIFGYILFNPLSTLQVMILPIPMPAIVFGTLYLIYCHFASKHARDHVNHDAHLYGAISGILIAVILRPDVVHLFSHQVSAGVQSWFH
jgi:membrane associated rhomboid family serine protease